MEDKEKRYSRARLFYVGVVIILCVVGGKYFFTNNQNQAEPGSAGAALKLALVFAAVTWQTNGIESYSVPVIKDGNANVKVEFDKVACEIDLIADQSQIEYGWLIKNAKCKEKTNEKSILEKNV